ncbi:hypothetical protein NG895_09640 [Aeoliella sp. ICT_H6.2]|uniref:PEP-CTERM protein-sorting domain-containing protein n=1 Tax=Aeoliella straminimaris TaxID=2954799 RepID=A0A9X2F962_9BACT|nr:hypothetical protein [Aeoliella straminimaris]MCO6044169.1 hypothetical protein [Aeoliella straminimaris]
MRYAFFCAAACILVMSQAAEANSLVVGGRTNVNLDFDTLESAASLTLSSTAGTVAADPSYAVAFGINPRDGSLPTTFEYDPATFPALGSFAGTIEHTGTVSFNSDTVTVGDFTIGFDAARAGGFDGAASGFYVESTTGIPAILFDFEVDTMNPPIVLDESLTVAGNLLVSNEFGTFLLDQGLSSANLAGAPVGSALIEATAIPEPSSVALGSAGILGMLAVVRSKRK